MLHSIYHDTMTMSIWYLGLSAKIVIYLIRHLHLDSFPTLWPSFLSIQASIEAKSIMFNYYTCYSHLIEAQFLQVFELEKEWVYIFLKLRMSSIFTHSQAEYFSSLNTDMLSVCETVLKSDEDLIIEKTRWHERLTITPRWCRGFICIKPQGWCTYEKADCINSPSSAVLNKLYHKRVWVLLSSSMLLLSIPNGELQKPSTLWSHWLL